MRLSIDHTTGFRYASAVGSSYNEARMVPVTTQHQSVWSSRVSIEPQPWSLSYVDYWGTHVTTFELHEPHDRLTVHAQSVVDTRGDHDPWDTEQRLPDSDIGWDTLENPALTDSMAEFLTTTARTEPAAELAEIAAESAAKHPPRLAALDLSRQVGEHLTYQRGSTAVTSTAREVWEGRRGVCQDYSHVLLGALRRMGVPARYVSGYLYPGLTHQPNVTVNAESHSWVEWWCGSWVAFDPTVQQRLSDSYVRVGHGRDYGDVAPLRGTYSGGGSSTMFVTVAMTQLG